MKEGRNGGRLGYDGFWEGFLKVDFDGFEVEGEVIRGDLKSGVEMIGIEWEGKIE